MAVNQLLDLKWPQLQTERPKVGFIFISYVFVARNSDLESWNSYIFNEMSNFHFRHKLYEKNQINLIIFYPNVILIRSDNRFEGSYQILQYLNI